jgi:hypothetical protein
MTSERQEAFYETFRSSSNPKSESEKIKVETEEYSTGIMQAIKPSQIFSSFLWLAILSLWNFIMVISEVLSNWIVNGAFVLTLETLLYFVFNVVFVLFIFIGLYYIPRLSKRTYARITNGLLGTLSGLLIVASSIYFGLIIDLGEIIWLIPIPIIMIGITWKEENSFPFNLSSIYLVSLLGAVGICDLVFNPQNILLMGLNSWLSLMMVYISEIMICVGIILIRKTNLPKAKSFEFEKLKIHTEKD